MSPKVNEERQDQAPTLLAERSEVLVLAAVGIVAWILVARSRQPSIQGRATVGTTTPGESAVRPVEKKARGPLAKARQAVANGDKKKAERFLTGLETECSGTDFHKANRAAIATLRARLRRVVPTKAPATKTPPKPEPKKPPAPPVPDDEFVFHGAVRRLNGTIVVASDGETYQAAYGVEPQHTLPWHGN